VCTLVLLPLRPYTLRPQNHSCSPTYTTTFSLFLNIRKHTNFFLPELFSNSFRTNARTIRDMRRCPFLRRASTAKIRWPSPKTAQSGWTETASLGGTPPPPTACVSGACATDIGGRDGYWGEGGLMLYRSCSDLEGGGGVGGVLVQICNRRTAVLEIFWWGRGKSCKSFSL
jgi:hypothetical protein